MWEDTSSSLSSEELPVDTFFLGAATDPFFTTAAFYTFSERVNVFKLKLKRHQNLKKLEQNYNHNIQTSSSSLLSSVSSSELSLDSVFFLGAAAVTFLAAGAFLASEAFAGAPYNHKQFHDYVLIRRD